jgi:hypothetical protein
VNSTAGHGDRFTMDRALCGPPSQGPSPCDFLFKNKSPAKNASHFANNHLPFYRIKPQSPKFPTKPLVFEIFSKIPLATFQKFQIGPYNFLSPYLCNRNSDFGDYCVKIHRITSSFIICIHLTHVCCILLIDCVCFVLGNVYRSRSARISKPKLLKSPNFSLWISKASYLEHIVPIVIFLYLLCRIRTA